MIAIGIVIFYILIFNAIFRNRIGKTILFDAAVGLITGGAAGNILDRFLYGYVVDFIDIRVWPVFNIADCAITVGVVILAAQVLRKR